LIGKIQKGLREISTVTEPGYVVQAANSRQQTADRRQQTADSRQETADSRQQAAGKKSRQGE
jgi:hypothetical protein